MTTDKPVLDAAHFSFFREFLLKLSGYSLREEKRYLLESRARQTMAAHNLPTVDAFIAALNSAPQGDLALDFLEAMTINETLFFRDTKLFTSLGQEVVPEFMKTGRKTLSIWSAACSQGQEPYSIAMALEEKRQEFPDLDYRILASDINRQVLEKAGKGIYTEFELKRGLPEGFREKYFTQLEGGWQIRADLKQRITFCKRNLKDAFTGIGNFDVIFMRNILIYFDDELKEDILARSWDILNNNGYLALGGTESIARLNHPYPRFAENSGFYRKKRPV